jgi:Glycosyltransferase family 9 (heptosyltransferase)
MDKALVIKFWWKLGDTIIGISPFYLKHGQPVDCDFFLQNAGVVDFLGTTGLSAKKIPSISKDLGSILRLLAFFIQLLFFISKYNQIFLLESGSSWWYKILSLLTSEKKIITLADSINAYDALRNILPTSEKIFSAVSRRDSLPSQKKSSICIGVWIDTWEYRWPSIHTWIQFCKSVLNHYPEYTIQFLGSGAREQEFVDQIMTWVQDNRLTSYVSLQKMELKDILPIVTSSQLNIMVDSWLAHFCNLVSTPEIFIFWPDTPEKWFPYGRENRRHLYYNPWCSPCPQNWIDKTASCENPHKGKCTNSRLLVPTLLFMLHQTLNRS